MNRRDEDMWLIAAVSSGCTLALAVAGTLSDARIWTFAVLFGVVTVLSWSMYAFDGRKRGKR